MHRLTRRELKMLRDAAADKYHTTSGAAQRDYANIHSTIGIMLKNEEYRPEGKKVVHAKKSSVIENKDDLNNIF